MPAGLPGELIPFHAPQAQWLRSEVSRLCNTGNERFPGAQPVSFLANHLDRLEREDFWVCEKSDGTRVLLFIFTDASNNSQDVFLIDRHNSYRMLSNLFFPHHENPMRPLGNTILDGELVTDVDRKTKQETLRFLAFDALVIDNQNVMQRYLESRYGRVNEYFYKPYAKMLRDHPQVLQTAPFQIKVKQIRSSYHADEVFKIDMPNLEHGSDGLIYTAVNAPYTCGTDKNIMKWKPPSENSIDFRLVLRFPPLPTNPTAPDFRAKPVFLLKVWAGGEQYESYDQMLVTDSEWEEMKAGGEQYDDRVVEVHWDPVLSGWRMMRFRSDKPHGNHKDVVENILKSITDGVEQDILLSHSNAIRNAWKQRHSQPPPRAAVAPPPPKLQNLFRGAAELHYGPLGPSKYSKVAGPPSIGGLHR